MGCYRFLLALLVLMSHCGVRFFGLNPGVVAVISFFILSGFVMTTVIENSYPDVSDVGLFYIDRVARLFPQFLLYCALAVLAVQLFPLSDVRLSGCNVRNVSLNLLMLPLDFYFQIGMDNCLLIPQAWSLGLELCFYLVVPFFLVSIKRGSARLAICAASAAIFAAAVFGIVPTNEFGYIWLPGTFFIFACGVAFADAGKLPRAYPAAAWIFAAVLFCCILLNPRLYAEPYNRETLVGILIGIPAVLLIKNVQRSVFDDLLGNLSYGIFLNHLLLLWILKDALGFSMRDLTSIRDLTSGAVLVVASCLLSALTFYGVEKRFLELRRNLRHRNINHARTTSRNLLASEPQPPQP